MYAKVYGETTCGINGEQIIVEVDISNGLPSFDIVGLPDTAVSEARERLRAAIKNAGLEFPLKKVVINLAPADMRKEGSGFDLPMAVGILLASGNLDPTDWLESACFVGEVSLAGELRRVHGALSLVIMAKTLGYQSVVVPEDNVAEASLVEGIDVYGLSHLQELPVLLLHPASFLKPVNRSAWEAAQTPTPAIDFKDVKGQAVAKRALEIAAAGGHNLIMIGPPGSGKSMLAKALPGILPPLAFDEMLEVSRIYSVAGLLSPKQCLVMERPFRSPHHSASIPGITGGGTVPKPGEISLAHRGVLFLDELVEFPRPVLEVLRQPLEDGTITISRARQHTSFPAKCMVLAAMNPCPCGYRGDTSRQCVDSEHQIQRYVGKLSGPLLDRIDLHIEVPRLSEAELLKVPESAEDSATVRARVIVARQRQLERLAGEEGVFCNAELSAAHLKVHAVLDDAAQQVMAQAIRRLNLSARSFDRILRLARTIADLAGETLLSANHLAEALQYRAMDRLYQLNAAGV